jgi:hypothetical protein
MTNRKIPKQILLYENLGFLAIIILSWANELLDLPRIILGGVTRINWREAAMETILVSIVWISVHAVTKKLLARLHYLESFLRVCAWCRKIGQDDDWLPLEQYFSKGFDITTSHGICPACKEKVLSGERSPDTPQKRRQ